MENSDPYYHINPFWEKQQPELLLVINTMWKCILDYYNKGKHFLRAYCMLHPTIKIYMDILF